MICLVTPPFHTSYIPYKYLPIRPYHMVVLLYDVAYDLLPYVTVVNIQHVVVHPIIYNLCRLSLSIRSHCSHWSVILCSSSGALIQYSSPLYPTCTPHIHVTYMNLNVLPVSNASLVYGQHPYFTEPSYWIGHSFFFFLKKLVCNL